MNNAMTRVWNNEKLFTNEAGLYLFLTNMGQSWPYPGLSEYEYEYDQIGRPGDFERHLKKYLARAKKLTKSLKDQGKPLTLENIEASRKEVK
jgi:hypothetical protein